MKQKVFLMLALLLVAATGVTAQSTYTVQFKANNNTKTVENVTLPHTFWCNNLYGNGELDQIIKQLYGWNDGGCDSTDPIVSGSKNVTAGYDSPNQYITISAPFEGTTTVSGSYFVNGGQETAYSLEISIPGGIIPTYKIAMKKGTADSASWAATPNPAEEGKTVTLKYDGVMKVKSVKAKKAAPTYTLLSAATAEDIGKVVCADGHLHDAKTAVPAGCTAVGILGKVTETGHGLILALKDAKNQNWNTINGWTSVTTYAGTTLKLLPDDAARGTNLTSYTTLGETAVSNWAVAQKSDYEAIFTNLGSTTDSNGKTCDGNVNAYITTGVGGTAISDDAYWSATEKDGNKAWNFSSDRWNDTRKTSDRDVWPVLGF